MTSIKSKECFSGPLDNNFSMDELYTYFRENIQNKDMSINGMKINFFDTLNITGTVMYAESFHHITTKRNNNSGIREPEDRRFYINHIVPMIENINECKTCSNSSCSKIKIWTAPYSNKIKRTKILYIGGNYNYMIILENDIKCKNQLNVITSYLGNEKWFLPKIMKEYNKYCK